MASALMPDCNYGCSEFDPREDTETSSVSRVAGGVCGCSEFDPREDTETFRSLHDGVLMVTVAANSIRERILKPPKAVGMIRDSVLNLNNYISGLA